MPLFSIWSGHPFRWNGSYSKGMVCWIRRMCSYIQGSQARYDNLFLGTFLAVSGVAIIGVGKDVLSCSRDGSVIKWSCAEDKQIKRWDFEAGPCNAICIGIGMSNWVSNVISKLDHISTWFAVACESRKVFIEDANESEVHYYIFSRRLFNRSVSLRQMTLLQLLLLISTPLDRLFTLEMSPAQCWHLISKNGLPYLKK